MLCCMSEVGRQRQFYHPFWFKALFHGKIHRGGGEPWRFKSWTKFYDTESSGFLLLEIFSPCCFVKLSKKFFSRWLGSFFSRWPYSSLLTIASQHWNRVASVKLRGLIKNKHKWMISPSLRDEICFCVLTYILLSSSMVTQNASYYHPPLLRFYSQNNNPLR